MRRSIDDDQIPVPPLEDDADDMAPVNWAVSICDDYDDAGLRVQMTVEEVGAAGPGTSRTSTPTRPAGCGWRCAARSSSWARTRGADRRRRPGPAQETVGRSAGSVAGIEQPPNQ